MRADTLRFDVVDHAFVIVHANVPPDEQDWARLTLVRDANRRKIRGILVVAPPRASLDAAQRASVTTFMKETRSTIAVVTDSALIRGVARAVGFMGVQVRAFAPSELARALDYLVVPASRHADFTRRVEILEAQLATVDRPPRPSPA